MALDQAQLDKINDAITAVENYASELQFAKGQASLKGNLQAAAEINSRRRDALGLLQKLDDLVVIAVTTDLAPAVAAIQHTTDTLNQEKQQIDAIVAAFATAGKVISAITSIVTAIGKI